MRALLHNLLVTLDFLALVSGSMLVCHPDSSVLDAPLSLLWQTPFRDFFWSGLILGRIFDIGSLFASLTIEQVGGTDSDSRRYRSRACRLDLVPTALVQSVELLTAGSRLCGPCHLRSCRSLSPKRSSIGHCLDREAECVIGRIARPIAYCKRLHRMSERAEICLKAVLLVTSVMLSGIKFLA